MADNGAHDGGPDDPIPGLWMSETELEETIAADRMLIERGLRQHEESWIAMEAQERARDAAIAEAAARGEQPAMEAMDEEKAWDAFNDRLLMGIAMQKKSVLDAFGLDPRRSALFGEFPELLARACDPQCPVLYDPSERQFALMETWGPAVLVIDHCPWSGKPLPQSLSDEWNSAVSDALGTDNWSYDDAREKLPREFWTEEWWRKRGL